MSYEEEDTYSTYIQAAGLVTVDKPRTGLQARCQLSLPEM